jgi:hypothetical protein
MRPKAGENFHVGRGAHPIAPEGGRAPRDTGAATARRARIGGVLSGFMASGFMASDFMASDFMASDFMVSDVLLS